MAQGAWEPDYILFTTVTSTRSQPQLDLWSGAAGLPWLVVETPEPQSAVLIEGCAWAPCVGRAPRQGERGRPACWESS